MQALRFSEILKANGKVAPVFFRGSVKILGM